MSPTMEIEVDVVLDGKRWSHGLSTRDLVHKHGILEVVLVFFSS